ncbi:CHAD domain-containing protein, partial [Halovibrio sp. HP20-59]
MAKQESGAEGVHQMRVALRRLRTICVLFRHEIPSPA